MISTLHLGKEIHTHTHTHTIFISLHVLKCLFKLLNNLIYLYAYIFSLVDRLITNPGVIGRFAVSSVYHPSFSANGVKAWHLHIKN